MEAGTRTEAAPLRCGRMPDRVDELFARIANETDNPTTDDLRDLLAQALAAGATDDEIMAAARRAGRAELLLDVALRPPGETVSLDAFIAGSGLDPRFVRLLWRAFDLPTPAGITHAVAPDVADAMVLMASLAEAFGDDAVLGLARVIGSSTAHLADALASATRVSFEMPKRDTGAAYAEISAETRRVARDLLPPLWDAIGAVLRRHIVLVSYQAWAPDDARTAITVTRTVGFVDLVGSTGVLRAQTVAEIATSVDRFERLVWDLVTGAGGRAGEADRR